MAQGLNPTARLQAHLDLQRVRVSVLRGGDGAGFKAAVSALGQLRELFSVATAQLDHAESLIEWQGTEASGLLAEARPVFERLGAVPRLERLERAEAALAAGLGRSTRPPLSWAAATAGLREAREARTRGTAWPPRGTESSAGRGSRR